MACSASQGTRKMACSARNCQVCALLLLVLLLIYPFPMWGIAPASDEPLWVEYVAPVVADTHLEQRDGTDDEVERGDEPMLKLRLDDRDTAKALVRFDLSGIPRSAEIVDVKIEFEIVSATPNITPTFKPAVSAYRVLKPWTAQANWTYYAKDASWCLSGASGSPDECPLNPDLDPNKIGAEPVVDPREGTVRIKYESSAYEVLAGWVSDWISGRKPNNGILLALHEPIGQAQSMHLASSEYLGPETTLKPRMTVVYRPPTPTPTLTPTITPTPSRTPSNTPAYVRLPIIMRDFQFGVAPEPNNNCAEARNSGSTLLSGVWSYGRFDTPADYDLYWIGVLPAGQTIACDLVDIPGNDDYDIYLLDCDDLATCVVDGSENEGNADESFEYDTNQEAGYSVWVVPRQAHSGTNQDYRIRVNVYNR